MIGFYMSSRRHETAASGAVSLRCFQGGFSTRRDQPMAYDLDGYSVFDDKGEVKRLVDLVVRETDPQVAIARMRKIDFSYIFTLSKGGKVREVELTRDELDASLRWRNGNIDQTLQNKIERAISGL
jgi:hypothetical protein